MENIILKSSKLLLIRNAGILKKKLHESMNYTSLINTSTSLTVSKMIKMKV